MWPDLIILGPLITSWRAELGFESTEIFHKWSLNAGYITSKNSPEKFLLCTWKGEWSKSHLAGQRIFSADWNSVAPTFGAKCVFVLDQGPKHGGVSILETQPDGAGSARWFSVSKTSESQGKISIGVFFLIKSLTGYETILWPVLLRIARRNWSDWLSFSISRPSVHKLKSRTGWRTPLWLLLCGVDTLRKTPEL